MRKFKAVIHSTDAHLGVEIPVYQKGNADAFGKDNNEYFIVTEVTLVTAAGGDCAVYFGADNTLADARVITRGTFAVNGGITEKVIDNDQGKITEKLWVKAPAGVVDVIVRGYALEVSE